MDSATFDNQLQQVFEAFQEAPRTMLQVSVRTGILRSNICRYVAHLKKRNKITIVKRDKCPLSKHKAAFYSTNPALIPKPGQSELFQTEGFQV